MTTQEIADKLVAYCRAGDYDGAYAELFSDEIISIEPEGSPGGTVQGKAALMEKGKKWAEMMETFIWGFCDDPIVADRFFAVRMWFEAIYKGETEAKKEEELALYEVKDGKVIKEQFFYTVTPM